MNSTILHLTRHRNRLIPTTFVLFFFLLSFHFLTTLPSNSIQPHQIEPITYGWMIAKHHQHLYQDIITQHQPIPMLISQIFFSFDSSSPLSLLLVKINLFTLAITCAGAIIISQKFGWIGAITSFLIETSKFYLFGFQFTALTLSTYPLVYIHLVLLQKLFYRHSKPSSHTEAMIFGFSLFWLIFSSKLFWPFAALAFLTFLFTTTPNNKLHLIVGIVAPTVILFNQINYLAWLQETIINPFVYFIPKNLPTLQTFLATLFYPILSFTHIQYWLGSQFASLFILILIALTQIHHQWPQGKTYLKSIWFYLLIASTNLQVWQYHPTTDLAHMALPQLAILIASAVILLSYAYAKNIQFKIPEVTVQTVAVLTLSLFVGLLSIRWWYSIPTTTPAPSDIESLGRAINSIQRPTDSLLHGSVNNYLNLVSQLPLDNHHIHQPWSYHSPQTRSQVKFFLTFSPPAFIYFPPSTNPYSQLIQPILDSNYTATFNQNHQPTHLYILTSSISSRIDWHQWTQLGFQIPSTNPSQL